MRAMDQRVYSSHHVCVCVCVFVFVFVCMCMCICARVSLSVSTVVRALLSYKLRQRYAKHGL